MKHRKLLFLALVAATTAFETPTINAAQTDVGVDFFTAQLLNAGGTALTAGTNADGDGAIIQVGYFDAATTADNFAGNWVALTGIGGANSAYGSTSVGDSGGFLGNGNASFIVSFVVGSGTSGNGLVSLVTGVTPLAFRFFDSTSSTSASYNTVSSDSWIWQTPADAPSQPSITMSDGDTLVWESISKFSQAPGTAFRIVLPIPEPSTFALIGLTGLIALGVARRARRS